METQHVGEEGWRRTESKSCSDFRGHAGWTLQIPHHRSTQASQSLDPELQLDAPHPGRRAEGATASKGSGQTELQNQRTCDWGKCSTSEPGNAEASTPKAGEHGGQEGQQR